MSFSSFRPVLLATAVAIASCDGDRLPLAQAPKPDRSELQDAAVAPASTFAPDQCVAASGLPVALEAFRNALADGRARLIPALASKPAKVRLDHALEALDCAVSSEDEQQANVALKRAEAVIADANSRSIGEDVDVMAIDLLLQRGRDFYPRQ